MKRAFEKWRKLFFSKEITWSKRALFWSALSRYSYGPSETGSAPWAFAARSRDYQLHWSATEERGWELFYSYEIGGDLFNDHGWVPGLGGFSK